MGPICLTFPLLARLPGILLRCLVLAVLAVDVSWAQSESKSAKGGQPDETDWPVPNEPLQLFYIQRDPDINTVIYQLNMEDGQVDSGNPVNVYWIRYAEDKEHRPLNYIQRTMAFGISHKELDGDDYELQLVSRKELRLRLSYSQKEGRYVVYTQIKGAAAILDRIYVRIEGGSMFSPNITYYELSGRSVSSGDAVSERIAP